MSSRIREEGTRAATKHLRKNALTVGKGLPVVTLLVLMAMTVTGAAHGFDVTFADSNLELAVRTEINKPSGSIQNTDLVGVGFTSLRASSLNIQNLSGLEYCTDLTHVELYGNKISDISVLASLTSLRDIYLWNNQIVDITPLTDLAQLKYVFLHNNLIQDILPLFLNPGLGAGDIVNISGNPIDQVGLCYIIPSLRASGVSVSHSGACGFIVVNIPDTNLEKKVRFVLSKPTGPIFDGDMATIKTLTATNYDIADITGLEYCSDLEMLNLTGNRFSNLSPLSQLSKITRLYLGGNNISDLTPLAGLQSLVGLELQDNAITSLEGIGSLTYLEALYLHKNQISDIGGLGALRNLTTLTLGTNRISNIDTLSDLVKLVSLDLTENQITSLLPLAPLTKLERLSAAQNLLTTITPVAGLTKLAHLDLSKNSIQDLQPLAGLQELTTLYLDDNLIVNIDALAAPQALSILSLRNNRISDLGPLVANSGLGAPVKVAVEDASDFDDVAARGSDSFLMRPIPFGDSVGEAFDESSAAKESTYTLALNPLPSRDVGYISSIPAGSIQAAGTVVRLTAVPRLSWFSFDRWSGDLVGSVNPALLTMNSNKIVNAIFVVRDRVDVRGNTLTQDSLCNDVPALIERSVFVYFDGFCDPSGVTYTLTTKVEGSGTLEPAAGTRRYGAGAEVVLRAIPDVGWSFDRWEGDFTSTDSEITVVMDSDKRLTAYFVESTSAFTLTLAVVGNGRLNLPVGTRNYPSGSRVNLAATPDEGWEFDHWEGDLTGPTNPNEIVMNGNKTVTAVFVEQGPFYILETAISGQGTLESAIAGEEFEPAPASQEYEAGTHVQLRATPALGWVFDHWSGDLIGSMSQNTVIMDSDKSVTAVFVRDQYDYSLAMVVEGGGTTSPVPGYSRYYGGTVVPIIATPSPGWVFDHWSGDLSGEANPTSIIMDSNKTVTAVFLIAPVTFTLTTNAAAEGGTMTPPPGTYIYAEGKKVSLVALPDQGWIFDYWTGDIGGTNRQTLITMDGNKTVTPVFRPYPYLGGIVPSRGSTAGGETVTIYGGRLDTTSSVLFDDIPGAILSVTATRIDVQTPAHARGVVDVFVTTDLGTVTSLGGFTFIDPPGPPEFGALTPTRGRIAGGDAVLIRGRDLGITRSVTFGGSPATILSTAETRLTVLTPPHPAGTVDVVVTTSTGTDTGHNVFTYLPEPQIASVSPAEGSLLGGDLVTIQGSDLAETSAVMFGATPASIVAASGSQVIVRTPAAALPGIVSVFVTTPGGVAILPDCFEYFSGAATVTCPVYDGNTLAPMFNATINMAPIGRVVSGSADGLYIFTGIRPGSYTLVASASGYTTQTRYLILTTSERARVEFAMRPVGETPEPTCGLDVKRLKTKVSETVLPLSVEEAPEATVSPDEQLAIRLTAEDPIDPASVWAIAQGQGFTQTGGAWLAIDPADGRDGWVLFKPESPFPAGQTITLTAGAVTVNGTVVGPVVQTFTVDVEKRASESSGLVEDTTVDALPSLIAAGAASVYRVGPAGVFAAPVTVQIPVPADQAADQLAIYYYSEAASHTGWYPAENVVGWLVPESRQVVEKDGQVLIEVQVNHSGVLQLGKSAKTRLGSVADINIDASGSSLRWVSFVSVLLSLSLVLGMLLRRSRKA